jgi:hypothetical protein
MTGADDPLARIARFVAESAESHVARVTDARPVAIGWATVELDRAAAELADALGTDAGRFSDSDQDPGLGAYTRIARGGLAPALDLVLLEPSTEGRLSGTLARHGEGPVAAWLRTLDEAAALAALRAAGIAVAGVLDGPLGPARLILDGPISGPHRFLLVSAPGTIVR